MTWTYDLTQLPTSQLMQVRYTMGDTKSSDPQVQDEEITFALTQRPSVLGGASYVCRSLAAQLARQADTVDKDLRDSLSQRSRSYSAMADRFDVQSSNGAFATPYAGGISISDKRQVESNPDRVRPQFNIGMDDNYLPVAPAGNESSPGVPFASSSDE